jgi:uncharacterized membrane protein YiaA
MSQDVTWLLEISKVVFSGDALLVALVLLLLGLCLGYICVKAFRYLLSLIILLLLGAFLSLWSLSEHINNIIAEIRELALNTLSLLLILGVLTAGPLSAGFLIGVLLALVKR